MAARAPPSGSSVQAGAAAAPTTPERLEEVEKLLTDKEPWHAFLHAGLKVRNEWDNCPDGVGEALEWMASAAVGLLDVASIGPLKPVCKAFAALIEAAKGAIEVVDILKELVTWCAFLFGVFIEHGKQVDNLKAVNKPLNEFVSTTGELAKRAKVVAARSKCMAFFCHKKDANMISSFDDRLRRLWDDITGVTILDIQEIVRRLEERSRPLPSPDMAEPPAAALKLPPSHVKRAELEAEVVRSLTAADASGAPCVVLGMGGAGKSVLASSVVRTKEVRKYFRQGISWRRVGPGGEHELQALFEGLAREASPAAKPPPQFNSVDEVIQHLTAVVAEDTQPRLVILDDVWEREVVDTLRSTGLRLLVTTRLDSVVAVQGGRTVVGNMDSGEARELLKSKSGADVLPETEADQVAAACGWHALTLAIAGSLRSVKEHPNSASTWRQLASEIVEKRKTVRGPQMDTEHGDDFTKKSLFPVLELSLESLGEDEQRLLLSLVVLAPGVSAPVTMLASIWQKDNTGARKEADFFVSISLLQEVDGVDGSFREHDLLLDFVRTRCEKKIVDEAARCQSQYLGRLAVLRDYSDKGESMEGFYSLIILWRKLAELCGNKQVEVEAYHASLGELGDDESTGTADAFSAVGRLLYLEGKLDEAGPLFIRAMEIWEKALGPDHPTVATALNNRAGLLQAQGKLAEAEPLLERCQAMKEKVLGPDHPSLATTLNNRAGLLQAQGNYDEAGQLYERSLAIREKALGPDHPAVATALSNMAELLRAQGKIAEADPLNLRAIEVGERAFGPEHLDLAVWLNNRAMLLQAQGNYDEAGQLYERSLAIREKALGSDHPAVATALNNRAGLLRAQGKLEDADLLFVRVLEILGATVGEEHPNYASTLNNRAKLLQDQGKIEEADPLNLRAIQIGEKALGTEHPDLALWLNNRAELLKAQGNYDEAGKLYERSLAIREKALGPDHPAVAESLHNRAGLEEKQGDCDAALPLFERALSIRKKRLGDSHRGTIAVQKRLELVRKKLSARDQSRVG